MRIMRGDRSSDAMPILTGGIARRSGPSTGSVRLTTTECTPASGESGVTRIQEKITRAKITSE